MPFISSELLWVRNSGTVWPSPLSQSVLHSDANHVPAEGSTGKESSKSTKWPLTGLVPLWIIHLRVLIFYKPLIRGFLQFLTMGATSLFSSQYSSLFHQNKYARRARILAKQNSVFFNLFTEEPAHYFCLILFDWNHLSDPANTWEVERDYTKWKSVVGHYGEPCQKVPIILSLCKKDMN